MIEERGRQQVPPPAGSLSRLTRQRYLQCVAAFRRTCSCGAARPSTSNRATYRVEDRGLPDDRAAVPSGSTSNWSHARPGIFISAARRRRRSCSTGSTRQKSTVSPTARRRGHGGRGAEPRPRRRACREAAQAPEPVASTSPCRRRCARIGANAAAGDATRRPLRESTRRGPSRAAAVPRPGCRDAASDQRVSANSRSSFASARAIASRTPRGGREAPRAPSRRSRRSRCAGSRRACGRRRRTPASRASSQRLESRAVSTGTGIILRPQAALARVLAHELERTRPGRRRRSRTARLRRARRSSAASR